MRRRDRADQAGACEHAERVVEHRKVDADILQSRAGDLEDTDLEDDLLRVLDVQAREHRVGGVLVGQALGAEKPDRAEGSVRLAAIYNTFWMGFVCLVFLVLRRWTVWM